MRVLAVLLLTALASKAFSCSCVSSSERDLVAEADRIFLGVVEKTEIVRPESEDEWPYVYATFSVKDVVKGQVQKVEKVKTGFGGGDCGIPMVTGQAYVIFLRKNRDWAGICGGSSNAPRFEEEEYVSKLKAMSDTSNK
jgi:hypothetical protein